jgi:hypothetical protein
MRHDHDVRHAGHRHVDGSIATGMPCSDLYAQYDLLHSYRATQRARTQNDIGINTGEYSHQLNARTDAGHSNAYNSA